MTTNPLIRYLPDGDVEVKQTYADGDRKVSVTRTFRQIRAHVHQVFFDGSTRQTCDGLRATGSPLVGGDNLEDVIRKTLAKPDQKLS